MTDPAVRQTYLLDADGHVQLSSAALALRGKASALDDAYETPLFNYPGLLFRMKAKRSGYYEVEGVLLAWQRLRLDDWAVVVEAEPI